MHGDNDPTLVLGEAPESDDEYKFEENSLANVNFDEIDQVMKTSATGSEVKGEATESDEDVVFHNATPISTSRSSTILPSFKKPYSHSVKKLHQKNKELSENLASFKKQIFTSAKYEINNVNQQLLKSQIELQQTLMNLRVANNNLVEYKEKLHHIIAANYIPTINIQAPPNNT